MAARAGSPRRGGAAAAPLHGRAGMLARQRRLEERWKPSRGMFTRSQANLREQ